jgi:hypothetical protein
MIYTDGPQPTLPLPRRCPQHSRHHAGCEECRRYSRALRKRQRILRNRGQYTEPTVMDAAQARGHILALAATGMSYSQISRCANLSTNYVRQLAVQQRTQCSKAVAHRILAIKPQQPLRAGHVPATGTARRIRALVAIGYPQTVQATWYGMTNIYLSQIARDTATRVTQSTANTVRQAYDRMSMTPAPDTTQARNARNHALRCGWPSPLAWDDTDIDDAATKPAIGGDCDIAYDEPKVILACRGELPYEQLTRSERPDAIRQLNSAGLNDSKIAEVLQAKPETIQRRRIRMRLPARADGGQLTRRSA